MVPVETVINSLDRFIIYVRSEGKIVLRAKALDICFEATNTMSGRFYDGVEAYLF